jgi:hypothetical protein
VTEEEIIEQLLNLSEDTRKHLVAAYSDAAALFGELTKMPTHPPMAFEEMRRQQTLYVRVANALLDSIPQTGRSLIGWHPEAGSERRTFSFDAATRDLAWTRDLA